MLTKQLLPDGDAGATGDAVDTNGARKTKQIHHDAAVCSDRLVACVRKGKETTCALKLCP